ncbi:zinc finger MYM-type protein 5-like [Hydra vulgaris]|uniref:Zinc finger MYM-type protein 5-like n=1 Tax=Hydra vulgaris TaxID=6087 RepID=A0ABM4DCR6_HYDVU
MSKQLSGAQKRKINKQKQEECKSMSQQFTNWLKKNPQIEETNISRPSSDLQDEDAVLQLQPISLIDHNDIITNVENKNVKSTNVENACTTNVEIENIVINLPSITPNVNIIPQEIMLNYNDPNSWPAISNNVMYSLVKHDPEQGNNVNVNTIISADNTGRKFTKDWFYVKHINREMVMRKWLLYSINQNAIFCFLYSFWPQIS